MMRNIDPAKLEQLTARVSEHAAGALGLLLAYLGDRLGLYRALAEQGPLGSRALAEATGTCERYVREWLSSNAAGGAAWSTHGSPLWREASRSSQRVRPSQTWDAAPGSPLA
jgi:hypothetical protein